MQDFQLDEVEDLSIDEYFQKYPEGKEVKMHYGPKVHVLVIEKKERLVNGYRYIKELIYNRMAMKMFNLFNEVVAKGIPKGN